MVRKLVIALIIMPAIASAGSLVDLSFSNSIYMLESAQLRHAAELGDADSQFRLAWQYSQKDDSERMETIHYSPRHALHWYLEAARQGHVASAYNLAVIYAQGRGTNVDPVEAYAWLDYAADGGHQQSKSILADFEKLLSEEQIEAGLARQAKITLGRGYNSRARRYN